MLQMEIGFFHGVTRKVFQGPIVVGCIGVKKKGFPQVPDVSSTTGWFRFVSL